MLFSEIDTELERKPGKWNYAFRTVPKQRPEQTEILEWKINSAKTNICA